MPENVAGIVTGPELAQALTEKRSLKLAPIIFCEPHQTIWELQALNSRASIGGQNDNWEVRIIVVDGMHCRRRFRNDES